MKLYLDDIRPTPIGWERSYTVEETIDKLKTRTITYLSLDNDLGEGLLEGYNVLNWLEEVIFNDPTFPIPEITIHSSNESRKHLMLLAIDSIKRIRQRQIDGE